jgi:hypothetical protein
MAPEVWAFEVAVGAWSLRAAALRLTRARGNGAGSGGEAALVNSRVTRPKGSGSSISTGSRRASSVMTTFMVSVREVISSWSTGAMRPPGSSRVPRPTTRTWTGLYPVLKYRGIW